MTAVTSSTATRVWLFLAAASLTSYFLDERLPVAGIAATAVILIGAIKSRMVFIHFMELSGATQPWRTMLELWIGVVTVVILGAYWLPV